MGQNRKGAPSGNANAAKGFPTRPNRDRYPDTDGYPLVCDLCHVGERCPKFSPGAVCGYRKEFRDLSSRDADEVAAELRELAITQRERVARGILLERLMGGQPLNEVNGAIDGQIAILSTLAKMEAISQAASSPLEVGGIFDRLFNREIRGGDPASLLDD